MFDLKALIDPLTRFGKADETYVFSAGQSISALGRHELLETLGVVIQEVSALNRDAKIKLKERFRLMLQADEKVELLSEQLIAIFRGREVVDEIKPRHIQPMLVACWQEMASGYKGCLRQFAESSARQLTPSNEIATLRAIEYYARQATWAHLRYFEVEPRIWRNLHQLYLFADQHAFIDKPVQWHADDTAPTTVKALYMRAMLLYVSEPARRLPDQIWHLEGWARQWAREVRVERSLRPHDQLFAINLGEQRPPMRLRRNMVSDQYRYFDTTALAARLGQQGEAVKQGGDFAEEFGSISLAQRGAIAQLLIDLSLTWSRDGQARRRRCERTTISKSAEVAHGLRGIAKLFDGNADVNLDQARPAQKRPDMVEWTLEEESNSGLGANYVARPDDPLSIGELVAIRDDPAKRPTVGIVRRLHKSREGRVRVGVEKLGSQPALVSLQYVDKTQAALFSQDAPQANGARSLLMASSMYSENRECLMHTSGKAYRIRLGLALEILPTYIVASFLVLERL